MKTKTTMKDVAESAGVPPTGIIYLSWWNSRRGICGSLKGTQCSRW